LHITGGNPFTDTNGNPIYNNTIVAPIVIPIGGQSDSVFAALAADTYTVEVADANGCTVTQDITVPGTHMQLELTPTWEDATCDGQGGGWICGTPAEGRPWPPGYYMYELYDASTNPPTSLGPPGLDSCFTDLAEGMYQIRAIDSCNNFQTRDVILGRKTYASTIFFAAYRFPVLCDSSCLVIYPNNGNPWGEAPYTWEVTASTESGLIGITGVFDDDQDRDTLCFPSIAAGNLTLRLTDQCGNTGTYSRSWTEPVFNAGSGYECVDGGFINAGAPYGADDCPPDSTLTWELISGPAGFPLPPPQDSGYFPGLADGVYVVKHTDCCGKMYTSSESVSLPSWKIEFHEPDVRCDSFVRVKARYSSHGPTPTMQSWVITSAPPGYPNPIPDTTAFFNTGFTLAIGPRGTYCWEATDICGRVVDTCFTYDIDSLDYTYDIEVIPGCVTGNQLSFSLMSNYNTRFRVNQITPTSSYIGLAYDGTTFNNLTAGDYRIRYILSAGSQCDVFEDTITIPEYISPNITGSWGIECDNGVGLITVAGSNGLLPYTYELFQGPVTRPIQSTPSFPGLPIGTYDVRINDACNNSEITTVSIEPFMPVVEGIDGSFCLGDTAFLSVDYIGLATYSWSGPNGNTSDTSILVIPNLTLADAGTYTIDIDVANPDQTSCIAQTLTVNLDVFDCVCAPGGFTVNNIDCYGVDNGSVTATMISNAGAPFTYQWSNGGNTQTIANLPPGAYAVTIIDAGGCMVTADTTLLGAPKMDVTAGIRNISCVSTSDGEVTLNTNGGVPSYTYQWANGQMTSMITGLVEGTYKVSVTDANGCCSALSLMVGMQDCTPCELAENGVVDICLEIAGTQNHELATLDCDGGGIDNETECNNNGDPFDPADDCDVAITANTDICALIDSNPDHPLSNQDCDNGGVSNADECDNGGNPSDPSDDCTIALGGNLDLCLIIGANPDNPLAKLDCDSGGVDNYTECSNGGDPSDPDDDCQTAIVAAIDICVVINGDPNHPWASLDCDNGGIDNSTECAAGADPSDPADDLPCAPCDVAAYNGIDICELLGLDPNHPLATEDCDNGGVDNETECDNGGNPTDAADECDMAVISNTDICQLIFANPNIGLATMDCDNGGVPNAEDCDTGEDPLDAEDDCVAAIDGNLNICQLINYDPNHPLANQDCDNGGIDNWTECQNGGDPSDPIDDCQIAVDEQIDICDLIDKDPNHPIGNTDCDGDGVINTTECVANTTDPLDPCDFVDGSITLPVTADQSGCENLCPDLTPITTILPGNIAGVSAVGVAIEISELNGIDTDGSGILVRVPSDPRLIFVWNPTLTTVALTPVNNANWNYLGNNGFVHTFQYTGPGIVINGGTTEAFGFESNYNPQNTDGQTTVTATIVPFGGGECNILNNTDSERLVYFE